MKHVRRICVLATGLLISSITIRVVPAARAESVPEPTPEIVVVEIIPTATPEPIPAPATPPPTEVPHYDHDAQDVEAACRELYGSAIPTGAIRAKEIHVEMWCNRIAADPELFGATLHEAINARECPWYDKADPVTDENREVVNRVLDRIRAEELGVRNVGRILPQGYVYCTVNETHDGYTYSKTVGGAAWIG